MTAIIGIILVLAVCAWDIIFAGGSLLLFFDVPSLIIVIGFDLGALLVSGELKPFATGIVNLFKKESGNAKNELLAAASMLDLMFKCSIGGGIIGMVMGVILLLVNLNDPQTIGPYCAVAVITVFYGTMLAFLFFLPGKVKLANMAGRA